jgi:hypothetical protein
MTGSFSRIMLEKPHDATSLAIIVPTVPPPIMQMSASKPAVTCVETAAEGAFTPCITSHGARRDVDASGRQAKV